MKQTLIQTSLAAAVLLATLILHTTSSRAQGALTPPGAPAPAMKTLAQIEARTPVDATNTPGTAAVQYVINQPGSYYLTGNITAAAFRTGITIQTNDVTLDLNGFVMTGPGGSTYNAIAVVGQVAQNNVVIRNGTLRNWASGVFAPGGYCELDHVRVYGCGANGFQIGSNCKVKDCSAVNNGSIGILLGSFCQVTDCLVSGSVSNGISMSNGCVVTDCQVCSNAIGIFGGLNCTLRGCHILENSDGGVYLSDNFNVSQCTATFSYVGFDLGSHGQITECVANSNDEDGIDIQDCCTIKGCTANNNGSTGLGADGVDVFEDNQVSFNGSTGIFTLSGMNRIEHNTTMNNGQYGIESYAGPGVDFVGRNVSQGNGSSSAPFLGANYSPTNGTTFAPIQTPATATSPWANF